MGAFRPDMRLLISIDVEAHRVIDEITGPFRDSLGTILRILGENCVHGTFFVDVCEVRKWGREFMRTTCTRILSAGHEVQLHVHPHHTSGDNSRWLLSEYSPEEQETILSQSISDFEDLTGKLPTAFRAGGFGADNATVDILAARGIRVDSSYLWRRPGCVIRPPRISETSNFRGVLEVPLTPAVVLGTRKRALRTSCLDFNWLPMFAIERLLIGMRRDGQTAAVLLMHSSSMYVRVGRTRLWYRRGNERRLRRLLSFATLQGFSICTLSESVEVPSTEPEPAVLQGFVSQYLVLLYQAVVGFGISGKFRLFIVANAIAGAVLAYMFIGWLR